jgi:N-acyl homoserine lactone hydrolase
MPNLKIRPINTGYVAMIPNQYLYHNSVLKFRDNIAGHEERFPVFTFLIEGAERLMLIDTGMAWTERADKYHHAGSVQPDGHAIHEQLAKIGYKPEDIDIVVFTHLHWDHCFYMDKFTNAEYIVNDTEYVFAMAPIPLYYKSYEAPQLGITRPFEGLKFTLVSGEQEIIPGIRVFETPGHSPGHMSVEVDTKQGKYICAGDSIFIPENLDPVPELHYDITPPGRYADIVSTWKSIEIQKKRMEDVSHILCTHGRNIEEWIKTQPVIG